MSKKPDNPPAFPIATIDGFACYAMTLRDYFAATALQGILARPNTPAGRDTKGDVALHCYGYADAMLKVREAAND